MSQLDKPQDIPDKVRRAEEAKIALLDGTIQAISIDTCIFAESGYGLEYGNLKLLEQFKGNSFRLVLSEVIVGELKSHIKRNAEESKTELKRVLSKIGNFWGATKDSRKSILDQLCGDQLADEATEKRIKDFGQRCGVGVVKAKGMLDISQLLVRYFDVKLPFESSADKKSEFPDAIALLSLEAWGKKEEKGILFVTKDKGCSRFCDESKFLFAIGDIGEALSLIQQRDAHCAAMCLAIQAKVGQGLYPDLQDKIFAAINDDLWSIDWMPEAHSDYYYESEIDDIEISDVSYGRSGGLIELKAVDFRHDVLIARVTISMDIDAVCSFNFSVMDGIDRDMVPMGSTTVSTLDSVDLDVLLSFGNPNGQLPELLDVELLPARRTIDFGFVEMSLADDDY